MSFKKTFVKNVMISGSYNYFSQIISFLSTTIVSRFLGPESYGFVGIITIFTGFLSIFSDSGISLAVIRTDYKHTFYKSADNLSVVIGIGLCISTCLLAYPIALYFKNTALVVPTLVMSSLFVFRSMGLVRGALLAKDMQFAFVGRASLFTNVINIIFTIALAYAGAGYWALIIPQIIAALLYYYLLEQKLQLGFKIYPWAYTVAAFKYTKKTLGNLMGFNMINYWARNADNLIVGRYYGAIDLGIYGRAYNFLTLPLSLITGLIGSVLYPSLNKLKNAGEEIKSEYFFILKIITFASYPVSFILIMFPDELVLFLWGNVWVRVAEILPYFGLLVFSQSLLSTVGNILVLVKKETVLRNSGWVGAIVMISAISFGSLYSIVAIAQFYSLAFISVVLPFNVMYIYINTLRFERRTMIVFWCPIIIISISIWFGCFYNHLPVKAVGLIALLLFMLVSAMPELKKMYKTKLVLSRL